MLIGLSKFQVSEDVRNSPERQGRNYLFGGSRNPSRIIFNQMKGMWKEAKDGLQVGHFKNTVRIF